MNFDPVDLLLATGALPVAAAALLIERLFGYPNGPQAWIGHPVQWMGALIAGLDRSLNNRSLNNRSLNNRSLNIGAARRLRGLLALFIVMGLILILTVPLTLFLRGHASGWIVEALLASTLLSQKSLEDHVRAVADGLGKSLKAGRNAVAHIIGRDTGTLDESGVTRGALESLAENMSDGVLAPLFWLLVAGLPGAALYKAINTADSMIGYKSDTYRDFGWASARLDDLVNLIPARATGWLIALAAGISPVFSGRGALRAMASHAPNHRSPNAGWPETSLAGALDIRLGGPRSYQGRKADLAWMGDGRTILKADDIGDALRIYNTGLNITTALIVIACIFMWIS